MPLDRIRVRNFRCLTDVELQLDARRTYVFGSNGAGKTSFLEALFVLGRGRSFRTRQMRKLVQRGEQEFTVYGEIGGGSDGSRHRIGVGFSSGRLEKRVDGEAVPGMGTLAALLPVHVIDPGVHDLIQGGPSERRRFLDWGVFHVEPDYLDAWKRYRRLLSQRNAALKTSPNRAELQTWTKALCTAAQLVDERRRAYAAAANAVIGRYGQMLLGRELTVEYWPGWRSDLSFAEALEAARARESQSGTTEVGPHRADLAVRLDGATVSEEASRGQQKLCAAALVLAQTETHARAIGGCDLLLVDDPAAELDRSALARLAIALETVPAQLVITGLDPGLLPPQPGSPVFHVERGTLQAV